MRSGVDIYAAHGLEWKVYTSYQRLQAELQLALDKWALDKGQISKTELREVRGRHHGRDRLPTITSLKAANRGLTRDEWTKKTPSEHVDAWVGIIEGLKLKRHLKDVLKQTPHASLKTIAQALLDDDASGIPSLAAAVEWPIFTCPKGQVRVRSLDDGRSLEENKPATQRLPRISSPRSPGLPSFAPSSNAPSPLSVDSSSMSTGWRLPRKRSRTLPF